MPEAEILWSLDQLGEATGRQLYQHNPKIARGGLYVRLSRLESKGLVRSEQLDSNAARRIYALTDAGGKSLTDRELTGIDFVEAT